MPDQPTLAPEAYVAAWASLPAMYPRRLEAVLESGPADHLWRGLTTRDPQVDETLRRVLQGTRVARTANDPSISGGLSECDQDSFFGDGFQGWPGV